MSVRVKLRTDLKSMIKFGNKLEEQWFVNLMRSIRDSDPKTHPIMSIRDKGGEIPRLPPPKPPQGKDGKPILEKMEIEKMPPEILEKMKIEKVKVEKKTNEMNKRITPEEYLEESKQGKRCAVVGCLAKPSEKCPGCGAYYCNEHIKIHSHVEKEAKR